MSKNNKRVNIPIIPYGLRHEETIVQIASALDSIDYLLTDVFQQIDDTIAKHRQYLCELQKRSRIVAAKVEQLAGKNVATTVYSDSKFPCVTPLSESLFDVSLRRVERKPEAFIESKFQHAKYSKPSGKLHFYHVKSETRSNEEELILETGLGSIPSDVNCVSSLLLFNTSENLYQKYVHLDPLAVDTDPKLPAEDEQKDNIAAAPTSILAGHALEDREHDESFYSPPFVEVPSFNLPADLPALPGIADDSRYNFTSESPIAPSKRPRESAEKPKNIEDISARDLPVIAKRTNNTIKNVESSDTLSSSATSSHQASISLPPPPPPPPLPPTLSPGVPIPPPLPSIGNSERAETVSTVKKRDVPTKPAPIENAHATLMDAIRKAGGREKANLRPVEKRNVDSVRVTNSNPNNQFLDQLHNVLALRRKGISGQGRVVDKSAGGIMNRVSELIEPSSDSVDESEDSEGNNDWEE